MWYNLKELSHSQKSYKIVIKRKMKYERFSKIPIPKYPIALERIRKTLPEMPWDMKKRLMNTYHISSPNANCYLYLNLESNKPLSLLEDTVSKLNPEYKEVGIPLVNNYLLTDILGIKEKEKLSWDDIKLSPDNFAKLINNLVSGKISSRVAKDILLEIVHTNQDVDEIIKNKGLEQVKDTTILIPVIEEVINNNPKAIEDFKKGKENAIQFLVGQVMAKLKGAADPKELEQLIRQKIISN